MSIICEYVTIAKRSLSPLLKKESSVISVKRFGLRKELRKAKKQERGFAELNI